MRGMDNVSRSVGRAVLCTPSIAIHGGAHGVTRPTHRILRRRNYRALPAAPIVPASLSITKASVPNEHRRTIAAPNIMRLSRFPSLRCICQTALCCCTTHDDGMLFELH